MSNDSPDEFEPPEEAIPEIESFVVTITRQFEVDYMEPRLEEILSRTGAAEPTQGIEEAFRKTERDSISPEQKLLGIEVDVEKGVKQS
jgi:hypothetical protein